MYDIYSAIFIFFFFIFLGDGSVLRQQFHTSWIQSGVGDASEADLIFSALDVNSDGDLLPSELEHRYTHFDLDRKE